MRQGRRGSRCSCYLLPLLLLPGPIPLRLAPFSAASAGFRELSILAILGLSPVILRFLPRLGPRLTRMGSPPEHGFHPRNVRHPGP